MKHRQKTAKERPRRFFDYSLLFIVIFLVCFGLVMIYSTSSYTAQLEEGNSFYYLKRQAEFALLGFAGALIISRFDYHTWIKFAAPAFIGMTLIQLVIIFIGSSGGGQNRMAGNRTDPVPAIGDFQSCFDFVFGLFCKPDDKKTAEDPGGSLASFLCAADDYFCSRDQFEYGFNHVWHYFYYALCGQQ